MAQEPSAALKSIRDRSLVTVTALLRCTANIGLSVADLVEAITHSAFYAGWPNAMGAIGVLKTVINEKGETPS